MLTRCKFAILAFLILALALPAWSVFILTTSPLPSGTVGLSYQVFLAAEGNQSIIWSVVSGTLPPGITLSNDPPSLSGDPTTPGIYNFRLRATDEIEPAERDFTLEIVEAFQITTPSPLPAGTLGVPYNLTLATSGDFEPVFWQLETGSLPTGLSLSENGNITGTPISTGTFQFEVEVYNYFDGADSKTFELTILPPLVITTTSPLPPGTQGVGYLATFAATGAAGQLAWTIESGAMPAGVTLSPTTGALAGTPTVSGTFNFTVRATDSQRSVTKPFQLLIAPSPLTIITASPLPPAELGFGYASTLVAGGATGAVTWSVDSGTLPPSIALTPATGALTGTPSQLGIFNFVIRATDSLNSVTKPFQLTVNPPQLNITTTSLPGGVAGTPYSANVVAAGGVTPYSFSLEGTLPTGLTLSPAGNISGIPSTAGTSSFTIIVADSAQGTRTREFSITIGASVTITTSAPLPEGIVGSAYSLTFTASGGTPPYSFGLSAGSLPAGLSLNATGNLTGTPGADGSFPITVRVTDSVAGTSTTAFTLIIRPQLSITTSSLPNAQLLTPYTANVAGQGGLPPYLWSIAGSTLPQGISLNSSTGALSGTASVTGSFPITFTLTDSAGRTATRTLTLNVVPNISILTSSIPPINAGQPFRLEFTAEGGTPPYTWRLQDGILPRGLVFTSAGVLEGTAEGEVLNTINIRVTDQNGTSVTRSYTLTARPSALEVSSSVLPPATQGRPYSFNLQASGGTPPYQWELAGGSLPPGISMTAGGALSGTPTATGAFNFEVRVSDSSVFLSKAGETAAAIEPKLANATFPFRLVVNTPPLEITSVSPLPEAALTTPYSFRLAASGGRTPYFWAVTSGALPSGLALNENTGEIAGTPLAAGTSTFTIQARDNVGPASLRQFTLNVLAEADLLLSTYNVSFRVPLGRTQVTPQTVSVISRRNASVPYSVSATQPTPWLTVTSAAQSSTPSRFFLDVDPAGLAAGDYRAELRVVSPSNQQVIPLIVTLSVETEGIILEAAPNVSSGAETIQIRNVGGGGPANFVAAVVQGGQWLSVNPPTGLIPPDGSLPLVTAVNPSGLAAEYYRGLVRVTSGETSTDIPVLFDNTARTLRYALVPEGDRFVARQSNGAARPARSFLIRNDGSLPVVWSGSVQAGTAWLSLSRTSGSVNPGESAPVEYRVDAAELQAGNYYGRIRITAAGGPPQEFLVVLQVLPASTAPEPEVAPSGLLFVAAEGGAAPAAQTVQLYASSVLPIDYQASGYTSDQSGWLSFEPSTGTVSTASPASVRVSPVITGLKRGVYEGRIHFALSTTVVRDIPVVLIVTPPAVRSASSNRELDGCTASRLVAVHSGIPGNFSASAGWALPVAVRLYDDCGERLPDGRVVLRFSNGDPALPLRLTDAATAAFAGTWVPGRSVPQITITAEASAPPLPEASSELVGSVQSNRVPAVDRTGVLHQFNPQPGGPLAPGTAIQIFGTDLAASETIAETPLPSTLGGVTVIVAGTPVPLSFVSPTQVNAQLPFELSPGTPYQVIVGAGNAIVPPTTIRMNSVEPGVAANVDGTVLALHENGEAVTEAAPAMPGEVISVFLAGLGRTDPAVPAGTPAPADPFAVVLSPVTAVIDDRAAEVVAARLAAGLVGLYEVRVAIPEDMTAGSKTLVIVQDDREANHTTLPVGSR